MSAGAVLVGYDLFMAELLHVDRILGKSFINILPDLHGNKENVILLTNVYYTNKVKIIYIFFIIIITCIFFNFSVQIHI